MQFIHFCTYMLYICLSYIILPVLGLGAYHKSLRGIFLIIQAAEKALKAAQYADDAFKTRVHNLTRNAERLGDSQTTKFAQQLEVRVVDSTRMRYPDQVCYPQIPNDVYTDTMAREVLDLASSILDRVRNKLGMS